MKYILIKFTEEIKDKFHKIYKLKHELYNLLKPPVLRTVS